MDNQINKRIEIAKNYNSIYGWKKMTPEKREKTLKRIALLDYWIVMVLLPFLIIVSALSTFQIDIFSRNWTNAGLLVLMTMSLSIRAPLSYIEVMLQNHIKKIESNKHEFNNRLNDELHTIVVKLNRRKKTIYLTGIPVIIIMIPALLQVFNTNPYWDKFPPLVLIVSLYLVVRINYDIVKLKQNLKQAEN